MRPLLLLALLILPALAGFAQQPGASGSPIAGHWLGTLNVGVPMRLAFSIIETDGKLAGTMASVDQSTAKIPLSAATLKEGAARLEIAAIAGLFEGKLSADGSELAGTWSQGGGKFPLVLKRQEKEFTQKRPQVPKKPFPYREEEVVIPGGAKDVRLAGTFTVPPGAGPFPAVVLITGSGPQDRDESLMGHRPFLVLADHLARQGIAVLRCDDRGVAKSSGDHMKATTADFADDARAQIAWLRQRKEVDPKRTGIIGHSEGGIVAPMVAAKDSEIAFIVLLAGVGVPMKDLLMRQMEDMARLEGGDERKVARSIRQGREVLQMLTENLDDAAVEKRLREMLEEARREMTPEELAKAAPVETTVAMGMGRIRSPWQRWAIAYDPAPALRAVKCPVLAINGEKDCQVAAKENIEGIARALAAGGNKNVNTEIFPKLNHLFQTCQTGALKEYGEIEETMSPAVLTMVADWILKATKL